MGLGSAPIFSGPPIYLQQLRHLPLAPKASMLHLLEKANCKTSVVVQKSNLDQFCRHKHSPMIHRSKKLKQFCSQVKVDDSISDEACELVNGSAITIEDGADGIEAYLFKAVKNNNATGILLLSDIFGFEDTCTQDFAYRVACNGYNVLVPDLFDGDPWTKDRPTDSFQEWIAKQQPERIARDIFASAKWMMDEFETVGISNKLGIIGFCFGGGRVVDILAQDQGAFFGCGVSFYGTRIDSSLANNIKVPLLLVTGENDELCPINVLEDAVERNEELLKMVVFSGRGHGFAHRPQTPEEDADAEEAFFMMRSCLHDGLLAKN